MADIEELRVCFDKVFICFKKDIHDRKDWFRTCFH